MDDSFDDIFDAKSENISEATTTEEVTPTTPTETVEPAATETEETSDAATETEQQTDEQPRDDKGRFADKRNWVPVEALIAERQRREAEAQQRAESEQRYRELEAQQRQNSRPDPYENPEDYDAYLQEQITMQVEQRIQAMEAQRERQAAYQQSEQVFANFATTVAQHEPAKVQEALDYAAARAAVDDSWGQKGLSQPDPVAWFIAEKTRHAEFEQYAQDPQGFFARRAAEQGFAGTASAAPAPQPMAARAQAPRSLASAGSGSASTPTVTTMSESFDAIFDSKR